MPYSALDPRIFRPWPRRRPSLSLYQFLLQAKTFSKLPPTPRYFGLPSEGVISTANLLSRSGFDHQEMRGRRIQPSVVGVTLYLGTTGEGLVSQGSFLPSSLRLLQRSFPAFQNPRVLPRSRHTSTRQHSSDYLRLTLNCANLHNAFGLFASTLVCARASRPGSTRQRSLQADSSVTRGDCHFSVNSLETARATSLTPAPALSLTPLWTPLSGSPLGLAPSIPASAPCSLPPPASCLSLRSSLRLPITCFRPSAAKRSPSIQIPDAWSSLWTPSLSFPFLPTQRSRPICH